MKNCIFLLATILIMFSCKTNSSFKKELANNNEISFSLNCKDYKDRPVVSLEDTGKIFYFIVDTGTTHSYLNENGLKKFNFDLDENIPHENITVTIDIEDKRYLPHNKKVKISMPVRKRNTIKEKYVDGMLGIDFLSLYDNVVFDYKQKKIKFNQLPINDNSINMYKEPASVYDIFYSINGIEDFGLLDTGARVFVVRET